MVRIMSGDLGELIGPGADDWMTIDVVDADPEGERRAIKLDALGGKRVQIWSSSFSRAAT
jgi:hypothetical protein